MYRCISRNLPRLAQTVTDSFSPSGWIALVVALSFMLTVAVWQTVQIDRLSRTLHTLTDEVEQVQLHQTGLRETYRL